MLWLLYWGLQRPALGLSFLLNAMDYAWLIVIGFKENLLKHPLLGIRTFFIKIRKLKHLALKMGLPWEELTPEEKVNHKVLDFFKQITLSAFRYVCPYFNLFCAGWLIKKKENSTISYKFICLLKIELKESLSWTIYIHNYNHNYLRKVTRIIQNVFKTW